MRDADSWVTVPINSVLTIHNQTVMIHPILDEFYSPNVNRSSTFAQAKGQTVTNSHKEIITAELTREVATMSLNLPVAAVS